MACINNPLSRDGTNQEERLAVALWPDYVKVDERTQQELYDFAQSIANLIVYYDENDQPSGTWVEFFEVDDQQPNVQKSLFLSFLELFKYAQDHINTITKRHLDFYYLEVLQFAKKEATPSQAYLVFELAKKAERQRIEEGTLFVGGKDSSSKPILYQTKNEIVVNRAKIMDLRTVFLDLEGNDGTAPNIYAAPVANSIDGIGGDLEDDAPKWNTFGESQLGIAAASRTMLDSKVGFAFASPLLRLREGTRIILLTLELERSSNYTVSINDPQAYESLFGLQISGEKGWLDLNDKVDNITPTFTYEPRDIDDDPDTPEVDVVVKIVIDISIMLPDSFPAVANYNEAVHQEGYSTLFPLLKVNLLHTDDVFLYHQLRDFDITNIELSTDVTGVYDLILQNEQAKLNPDKPFRPFGSQPAIDSAFYIGHSDIFKEHLETLGLKIEWHKIPSELGSHYGDYDSTPIDNESFKVDADLLIDKSWDANSLAVNEKIFDDTDAKFLKEISLTPPATFNRITSNESVTLYGNNTQYGFIRLTLKSPDLNNFTAFGHLEYPRFLLQGAVATPAYFVNQPYTPQIKTLSLDYTTFPVTLGFNTTNTNTTEQFFHITPFGHKEINIDYADITGNVKYRFLPQYDKEGYLYIGLADLDLPQQISLLFQMADGSGKIEKSVANAPIRWEYLSDNEWRIFDSTRIVSDTTNRLQGSGIIILDLPKKLNDKHTVLPAGICWIRASIAEGAEGINKLVKIHPQAVLTEFCDKGNATDVLAQTLPAGQIKKPVRSINTIKKIEQPYASFGGTPPEQDRSLYTRISERLRHKRRSISIWDYERMILEQFPEVWKIKCINHTDPLAEIAPGKVTIIGLPNLRNKNAVNLLKPRLGQKTLADIYGYIEQYLTAFITLYVENPIYEEVLVKCTVGFREGYDEGFYGQQLNQDLIRYLSPWAYDEGQDIVFGGKLHQSSVLKYVEDRYYVDFVTNFELYHIIDPDAPVRLGCEFDSLSIEEIIQSIGTEEEVEGMEVIVATSAKSILVSAQRHLINPMKAGDYECEDDNVLGGIGYMIVNADFVVEDL